MFDKFYSKLLGHWYILTLRRTYLLFYTSDIFLYKFGSMQPEMQGGVFLVA